MADEAQAPTTPTVHPNDGSPANGWSLNFDWDHPANAKERAKWLPYLAIFQKIAKVCKEFVGTVDQLDSVFGDVEAEGLVWRKNLPPFPLTGTVSPMSLEDIGMALAVADLLYKAFSEEANITVIVEGQPVPLQVKPINLLRRLAKGAS